LNREFLEPLLPSWEKVEMRAKAAARIHDPPDVS
jgi:hypothetical protein